MSKTKKKTVKRKTETTQKNPAYAEDVSPYLGLFTDCDNPEGEEVLVHTYVKRWKEFVTGTVHVTEFKQTSTKDILNALRLLQRGPR